MTGTITQNDIMPVKIIRMRPDKYFMEFDVADLTAYQVYDGQTAWMTTPWTGNPKPQVMPPDRANEFKSRADFDGLLYNWQAKGLKAELAGIDTVNQELAYKIKVIRNDGGAEYYFIHRNSFQLVKRQYSRVIRDRETVIEVYPGDFRIIDGIPIAFSQETRFSGQLYNTTQFDSIVLNRPVEAKIFTIPDPEIK